MYKHFVEVILVVASPTPGQPGQTKFLMVPKDQLLGLPTGLLAEQESTIEVAARMLKYHTGIDARLNGTGWVHLVPCPLADHGNRKDGEHRIIGVPYGCMIPGLVKTKDATWYTRPELLARTPLFLDHMDILTAVCKRI